MRFNSRVAHSPVSTVDFLDPIRIEDERRHDATAPSLDGGMMRKLGAVEHLSRDGVMQANAGTFEKLRLTKATWTTTGVVIATYQILQQPRTS